MAESFRDNTHLIEQFDRFIRDLMRENITRTCFQPWEVELLLDIESCRLREGNRETIMRKYQTMARRLLEKGAERPLLLSEYLDRKPYRPVIQPHAAPSEIQ